MRRPVVCLVLACVLTLALRAPFYLQRQVFNPDEGTLAAVANTILDGGLPYRDSWDTRGPLTFYLYAGVFALFGRNNMLAVHGLAVLAVIITSLLLMLIGRRLGQPLAGDLSCLLYPITSFTYLRMDMLAANVEIFMVPLILLGLYAYTVGLGSGRRSLFFLSGLCYGLAFLTKQPALTDFSGILICLFLLEGPGRPFSRDRVLRAAAMVAGFILPVAWVVAVYLLQGAMSEFTFGFWTYYSRYFIPAMSAERRLIMIFKGPWLIIRNNAYLWATAAAGLAMLAAGLFRRRLAARPLDLAAVWGLTAFLGASGSGRAFGHYYIQALPPLTFLSVLFSVRFLPVALGRLYGRLVPVRDSLLLTGPRLASLSAILLAAAGYALPLWKYYDPTELSVLPEAAAIVREPVAQRNLRRISPPMRELVLHLRSASGSDDTIFVWGFYPQVYILADRRPASRFSYCIYLTGLIPWVNINPRKSTSRHIIPGSWDLLMGDLERNRPLFIVDTAPGDIYFWGKYPIKKYSRLKDFVDRYYFREKVIQGKDGRTEFHVYKRIARPSGAGDGGGATGSGSK